MREKMEINGVPVVETAYTRMKKALNDRKSASGFAGLISPQSEGKVPQDIPGGEGGIIFVGKKKEKKSTK